MAAIAEQDVKGEFEKHRGYFLDNSTVISRKQIRRYLEGELGLEHGALDAHKSLIADLCAELVEVSESPGSWAKKATTGSGLQPRKAEGAAAANKPPETAKEPQKKVCRGLTQKRHMDECEKENASEEQGSDCDSGSDSEGSDAQPRAKQRPASAARGSARSRPRKQRKAQSKASVSSSYGPRVAKLQRICKTATLGIPPGIYRGKDEDVIYDRFLELLAKHGLTARSSAEDIKNAREIIQKQRDLDGIDTSNIIEGRPRRGAAASAAANVNRYASMLHGEGSDSEGEGKPAKRSPDGDGRSSTNRKPHSSREEAEHSDEGSDSDEEDEGEEWEAEATEEEEEEEAAGASPAHGSESNQSDPNQGHDEVQKKAPTNEDEDRAGSGDGVQESPQARGGHRRAVLLCSDDDSE